MGEDCNETTANAYEGPPKETELEQLLETETLESAKEEQPPDNADDSILQLTKQAEQQALLCEATEQQPEVNNTENSNELVPELTIPDSIQNMIEIAASSLQPLQPELAGL